MDIILMINTFVITNKIWAAEKGFHYLNSVYSLMYAVTDGPLIFIQIFTICKHFLKELILTFSAWHLFSHRFYGNLKILKILKI